MNTISCKYNDDWLNYTLESLTHAGYCIVEDVLGDAFLKTTQQHLISASDKIKATISQERFKRAGEDGVLRLLMQYEPFFIRFLEIPELLDIVDNVLGNTAILHLQNGFMTPRADQTALSKFQYSFHKDYKRFHNRDVFSVNILFAISTFNANNGATRVVPGTHQQPHLPSDNYLQKQAIIAECPPGAMLVFDSTLCHAGGINTSEHPRLHINHQFTHAFLKQQIDYVRALGEQNITNMPARTQQLLGYYTRTVTNLDEYYQPEDKRLYQKNQG